MVLGLSIFLILTSALMILLVLLHKGKGSGLSDLFGGESLQRTAVHQLSNGT